MHLLVNRIVGRRIEASSTGHTEILSSRAIDIKLVVNNSVALLFCRLKEHCTGSIAKENARVPVSIIGNAAHFVCTDHQYLRVRS